MKVYTDIWAGYIGLKMATQSKANQDWEVCGEANAGHVEGEVGGIRGANEVCREAGGVEEGLAGLGGPVGSTGRPGGGF